jgi:hypothetical protein
MSALSVATSAVQQQTAIEKLPHISLYLWRPAREPGARIHRPRFDNPKQESQEHGKLDCLANDEQVLREISDQCIKIADELLGRLQKLKIEQYAKSRRWKGVRQALKTVWNKDLDGLSVRLTGFRD